MMTNDGNSPPSPPSGVETVILPRAHDVGGFEVRRALPARERQMIGPFIFFDQMGPGEFMAGAGLDVRPHPHIGLATVTYLFEGEILHRDSLGSMQPIRAGDVNWMTAGRGIAHSERTPPARRAYGDRLFGIQSWVALPKATEEQAPAFTHHPGITLPTVEERGIRLRLIAGTGWGLTSPVTVSSPLFYADVTLAPASAVPLPMEHEERGAYLVQGSLEMGGIRFKAGQMLLFRPRDALALCAAPEGARVLLLGGAAMGEPRFIFWNFVSSSRQRIEQAKADWKSGHFGKIPSDEHEFIPLPEEGTQVRAGIHVGDGSPTS
jgi:redox-sensitive bicupin YhaK (pirin superfamily)